MENNYKSVWLNRKTINLFVDHIAGRLHSKGMRVKNWDIKKCEEMLTETVLPTRLIRILNEHHRKVFKKLKEFENE